MTKRHALWGFAVTTLGLTAAAFGANPAGISYHDTTNVGMYEHRTGLLVAGYCNSDAPEFQTARAAGAEVLQFLDTVDVPDASASHLCPTERYWYQGDPRTVPLWPTSRVSAPNFHLADIRVGSAWVNSVVVYVSQLMRQHKVDGIFLDQLGARLPGIADWSSWPRSEQDAYTRGAVDLVRRLDAARRAINPHFIIINNNMWDRGDSLGMPGEAYVDGVVIEHHPATEQWSANYANHHFSNLGHRRVLAIARGTQDALAWARIPGVTHVTDQSAAQYGHPNPPIVSFHALYDR